MYGRPFSFRSFLISLSYDEDKLSKDDFICALELPLDTLFLTLVKERCRLLYTNVPVRRRSSIYSSHPRLVRALGQLPGPQATPRRSPRLQAHEAALRRGLPLGEVLQSS